MKRILVTGGTVFVSQFVASYYVDKGDEVYVLNRNTKPQVEGVHLIAADRKQLGNCLKGYHFDVVIDVTSYNEEDVRLLVEALDEIKQYIFISSSAVYPETLKQPFNEEQAIGENSIWKSYGTDKCKAEAYLLEKVPQAYILRPPYLYGPMQNVYREPFVFECALKERPFYMPGDGSMPLQFFHVKDLCRFIDSLLEQKPTNHIFNVGNSECVTIKEWVELCYQVVGEKLELISVDPSTEQRNYFSFYNYDYKLDVSKQQALMPNTMSLLEGLKESYEWYKAHPETVIKKDYIEYIDKYLNH